MYIERWSGEGGEKAHTVLFIQLVFGKQLLSTVLSARIWYE